MDEYLSNVRAIIAKLKTGLTDGGKIVWVSTTPVPVSYVGRNDSDVVARNAKMNALIDSGSLGPEVVRGADLYQDTVDRCNRNATWVGYPQTNDCMYLQNNGVHYSALGRRFTAISVAAHLMKYL